MALRERLAQLNQAQEREAQSERDKPRLIQEWQNSVDALLNTIQEYLSEYTRDGLMRFTRTRVRLREEALGEYEIGEMSIEAGPAKLIIRPVALMIIAARGRVDMHRQGRSSEGDRIMFLRTGAPDTDPTQWLISEPPPPGSLRPDSLKHRRRVPLDKAALERAVEFLLSEH